MSKEAKTIYISNNLTEWWNDNKRSFLWRKTNNPYIILCAEIMLQRTQAKVVEKVLKNFLVRYPSMIDLYNSDLDELKQILKPLGLIKRAQIMQSSAKEIIDDYNNIIPSKKEQLLKITGVGEYTSDAILCFAFGRKIGVLDTNTRRIITRIFGLNKNVSPKKYKTILKEHYELLLKKNNPKNINYSLLDLGAKICHKIEPECDKCPLKNNCSYFIH